MPADTTLGAIAAEKLGEASKAQLLESLNQQHLHSRSEGYENRSCPRRRITSFRRPPTWWLWRRWRWEAEDKAKELADLNPQIIPAVKLAKGAILKLPQPIWPAMAAFGLLIVFLFLVGIGVLLRDSSKPNTGGVTWPLNQPRSANRSQISDRKNRSSRHAERRKCSVIDSGRNTNRQYRPDFNRMYADRARPCSRRSCYAMALPARVTRIVGRDIETPGVGPFQFGK